jgi:D-glucuronyl C5-epimerase C-terminus
MRTSGCGLIAVLCGFVALAATPAGADAKRRSIGGELRRLYSHGAIDAATYSADRTIQLDVKRAIRKLGGTRETELRGVFRSVKGMAARGSMRAGRLYPLFLTLARNLEWWQTRPLLAPGARITFDGSELVWQYFPGQGIQLHPLANFGKLNAYAKARRKARRTEQLLDELMSVAVPRGGGLAWEYYFTFDGGDPPWVSGLAQGTALQAIARSARKLDRMDELLPAIREGLDLFEKQPPTGLRVDADGGSHYLQYSFAPGLRIANGFVQSLVGLYDVAQITGDQRAARLFADGDVAARAEVPTYDTGAWSLYSRGTSAHESDLHYHVVLRDFLANLCDRTGTAVYCDAEQDFTDYLSTPPEVELLTRRLRGGRYGELRFRLSKISGVNLTVTAPSGRTVLSTALGTVAYGKHHVTWKPPKRKRRYEVTLTAVDLAGNTASGTGSVEVRRPKKRRPE